MEGECVEPVQVSSFVVQYLEVFLHQSVVSLPQSTPGMSFSWKSPSLDFIKVNFDGAVFERTGEMGVGAVARDSDGHCLAWLAHRVSCSEFGELAEAWAAREAIQLALRKGWRLVVLEGNCAGLIQKLDIRLEDLSVIGPSVADIRLLARQFLSCRFLDPAFGQCCYAFSRPVSI
ncbi:UNVERIFIED_CONTAM: hypothetical protein Sradi_3322200 [Sesamum radiatum]|uniref:RNase H type-1 domain-containing protein n=1 Tax=Sesamum radiatum TaxID=300843 RepID=A0AAW2R226_SESRA